MSLSRCRCVWGTLLLLVAFIAAAPVSPALAQQKVPKKDDDKKAPTVKRGGQPQTPSQQQTQTGQPQPGQTPPTAGPRPKEPIEPGPYVTRSQPRDWTLTVRVDVRADAPGAGALVLKSPAPSKQNAEDAGQIASSLFNFQTLTMVFPVPPETSGAKPIDANLSATLRINDRVVDDTVELVKKQQNNQPYPAGTRLALVSVKVGPNPEDLKSGECRNIAMELKVPMTCWRLAFDEKNAMLVDWPKGEWPATAKTLLTSQMIFMDAAPDGSPYDLTQLKTTVSQWTKGNPKSVPPVMLAKSIASQVITRVQPTGDAGDLERPGMKFLRTGQLQGLMLAGPAATLRDGRGTDMDIAVLLAAAYREAGLPARIVIGWDDQAGLSGSRDNFLNKNKSRGGFRTWVEFCLYDEPKNTINWVAVDVVKQRKVSSRPPALDKPWPYFGSNDEFNNVAPIAFQFHPPTTVLSYGYPGFWGWMMTPAPPSQAYQAITVQIDRSSKRGDDDKNTAPSNPNTRK